MSVHVFRPLTVSKGASAPLSLSLLSGVIYELYSGNSCEPAAPAAVGLGQERQLLGLGSAMGKKH